MDRIWVMYQGDIRLSTQVDPFSIPGLPLFPLNGWVEITEDYLNRELSGHDVVTWGTFLFSEAGLYNEYLPRPMFVLRTDSPYEEKREEVKAPTQAPVEAPQTAPQVTEKGDV